MATIRVNVTDAQIIAALNTPGGAVYDWRNDVEASTLEIAHTLAPVNDVQNAQHRGGVVGTFQASFVSTRAGSNGHHVRATIENFADHAIYVEAGRGPSRKWQRFSWTGWGGEIRSTRSTRGRPGQRVLERAINAAYAMHG